MMESITRFLEDRLHLNVNAEKIAVAPVWERKFLGYRLLHTGKLGFAPRSITKFRERIRQITSWNHAASLAAINDEVNTFAAG